MLTVSETLTLTINPRLGDFSNLLVVGSGVFLLFWNWFFRFFLSDVTKEPTASKLQSSSTFGLMVRAYFSDRASTVVLWVIWSPDVELNLLPQSSQWYPVCSLIQNYSSKRLFGDETSLVSNLKSRCQIELFAAILTMKSCFSLIHENSFIDLWCFPWVFLSNLKFQYQYLLFFSIPTCFNT